MSYLRLRQICLVAHELAPREHEIGEVLGLEPCFRDPGVAKYGLQNVLFPAGGTFLEIVSPTAEATAAGRYLDRRRGDGGYMFIVDCDDLEVRREHIRMLSVRIVEDLKRSSDYATSEALHLHPKDTGGCLLSIDRHSGGPDMMGGYHWAGPDWRAFDTSRNLSRITGATIQCVDPEQTALRWAEILDRRPLVRPNGATVVRLDDSFARFVGLADDRGEGLSAVHVACSDPQEILARADRMNARDGSDVVLCGTRFILEASTETDPAAN